MARKREQAFTLLEMLLVVLIIGTLAALVVPQVGRAGEKAKKAAADSDLRSYANALERYKLNMGKYPTEAEGGLRALVVAPDDEEEAEKWGEKYVNEIRKDPWGHDWVYACPGEHNEKSFDLFSWGPDGEEGTEDDIANWSDEDL